MKLSNYVIHDWVLYGARSNIRALPNVCDGLTKTTRKLVWFLQNDKDFETVERLSLKAAERGAYEHGGSSIAGALTNMVKSFPGHNNVALFEGEGQFGHPSDPEASASRYVACRISEEFSRWFSKKDNAILEMVTKRGKSLEPVVMAPIAPLLLVNGSTGIGNGYACSIPQFLPQDVIRATLEVLEFDFVETPLVPNWVGWKGKMIPDPQKPTRYFPEGTFKRIDSSTILVDCLPPSYYEKRYESTVLIPLLEKGEITSFENESNEFEGWKVFVKFKRGTAAKMTDVEIAKLLKLCDSKNPINCNLTVWDTDGKINNEYTYAEEIVESWVDWRLDLYEKRRQHEMNEIHKQMRFLNAKITLMQHVIEVSKTGVPRKQGMIDCLNDYDSDLTEDQIKKLLNIPIISVTKEAMSTFYEELAKLATELNILDQLTAKEYMTNEVNELNQFYKGNQT